MREHASFFGKFLRRPASMGAVVPSSDDLGRRITEGIELERARTIVELGPGTGALTRFIVERAAADAQVLAVEIDHGFARVLEGRFPRVNVVHGSAERLPEYVNGTPADCIVSGLPWAAFPAGQQACILDAVLTALKPGGWFATFAYIHAAWLPGGVRFRRKLEEGFSSVTLSPVIWNNVPPAFVYRCRK